MLACRGTQDSLNFQQALEVSPWTNPGRGVTGLLSAILHQHASRRRGPCWADPGHRVCSGGEAPSPQGLTLPPAAQFFGVFSLAAPPGGWGEKTGFFGDSSIKTLLKIQAG